MRSSISPCLLAASIFVASVSLAGQPVEFVDGRVLVVAGAERKEDFAVLTLEGGGSISVPSERVVNWSRLTPPPPPPPPEPSLEPPTQVVEPVEGPWRLAAGTYADLIGETAVRHGIDPALLTSLAEVESALNPLAVSPKGAQGLLQLMPATAERFGVSNPMDPTQNVEGGARYLSWLLDRFEGRTDLALAGYNAGENAVERFNGIPPYRETRSYVTKVLNRLSLLSR